MLTVKQLSILIKKPEYTIRDYINRDERFRAFWHKEEVEVDNIRGKYKKLSWICDEGDIVRIIEFLNSKRVNNVQPKQHWSDITIHCYERKMRCEGCCFEPYCSKFTHPPLKKKVLEFVRLYGEPR